jgi:S1-C subfamily serine protease
MNVQRWLGCPLGWMVVLLSLGGQTACNRIETTAPPGTQGDNTPSMAVSTSAGGTTLPPNFVVQVVQSVGPAVVRINAARTVQNRNSSNVFLIFRNRNSRNGLSAAPVQDLFLIRKGW